MYSLDLTSIPYQILTELCKSVESRSMQYFKRKSMELEKNLVSAVKNFHNLDLWGVLRIEAGESREIGWREI